MPITDIKDIVPAALHDLYDNGCIDHPCTTCGGRNLESAFKRNIQQYKLLNPDLENTPDKEIFEEALCKMNMDKVKKYNRIVRGGFSGGRIPFWVKAIRNLRRMNRSQGEKLNKYRSAVKTLREQLEDLNLFNAKLLYVNKLLQNKSLSESQKKSVVKALDEAKNIGETKALYKSLTESLSSSKNSLNESVKFGSSSRVTTSSSGKKSVGDMDRWQILAGLKK